MAPVTKRAHNTLNQRHEHMRDHQYNGLLDACHHLYFKDAQTQTNVSKFWVMQADVATEIKSENKAAFQPRPICRSYQWI